jgi:hypothetical protein
VRKFIASFVFFFFPFMNLANGKIGYHIRNHEDCVGNIGQVVTIACPLSFIFSFCFFSVLFVFVFFLVFFLLCTLRMVRLDTINGANLCVMDHEDCAGKIGQVVTIVDVALVKCD